MHDACWLNSLQRIPHVRRVPLTQTRRSQSQWGYAVDEWGVLYQRFGFPQFVIHLREGFLAFSVWRQCGTAAGGGSASHLPAERLSVSR